MALPLNISSHQLYEYITTRQYILSMLVVPLHICIAPDATEASQVAHGPASYKVCLVMELQAYVDRASKLMKGAHLVYER